MKETMQRKLDELVSERKEAIKRYRTEIASAAHAASEYSAMVNRIDLEAVANRRDDLYLSGFMRDNAAKTHYKKADEHEKDIAILSCQITLLQTLRGEEA